MMDNKKLWIDTRLSEECMRYLNQAISEKELETLGLQKGDSVEWMQLEDGEVWKKVTKKSWSI